MTRYHFTHDAGESWGWPGIEGVSLSSKDDFEFLSASSVTVNGEHGPTKSSFNDRAYAILSGNGWFEVATERFDVALHDVVIVPKNTTYDFGSQSGMKVLIIDTPAYVEESETT